MLDVFKKIKFVKEHRRLYVLNHDNIPASIDDLMWVVNDMYDADVEALEVPVEAIFFAGTLFRYNESKSFILVKKSYNIVWKRFIVAKELAHIIIDAKEDWCPDGVEVIDGMFSALRIEMGGDPDHQPDTKTQSEFVAEMVATEILYPYELRGTDSEDVASGKTSYTELEGRYEVPAVMIGRAHEAWYKRICDATYPMI